MVKTTEDTGLLCQIAYDMQKLPYDQLIELKFLINERIKFEKRFNNIIIRKNVKKL